MRQQLAHQRQIKSIDDLLDRLLGVKKLRNGEYLALCPSHNDRQPSLSVKANKDKILLHCKAGCKTEAVVRALGLNMSDLFCNSKRAKKEIETTYPYHNIKGEIVYELVRFKPKSFAFRRPNGQGEHSWDLAGVTSVLYHLPDIIKAVQCGDTVYITEGEKDCDRIWEFGFVATTNPGGAGNWKSSYNDTLTGANKVVILQDNDDAGREHANDVAQSLQGKVKSLKIVELEGAKDISDWLDIGNTSEDLETLVKNTPEYNSFRVNENIYTNKGFPIRRENGKSHACEGENSPLSRWEKTGKTGTLADYVRAWVRDTRGYFSTAELDAELGLIAPRDKENRKKIIQKMIADGEVERDPKRNSRLRYVDPNADLIDITTAGTDSILPLMWPFGIERYVDLFPSNLVVVAGSPDAGKTALLLNVASMNMNQFDVVYFSSEMEKEELRRRTDKFPNLSVSDWKVEFRKRSVNFSDVIRPDWINIIDYMELSTDLFLVADYLASIQRKLNRGIAIVALQKKRGQELGRGAEFSLEKPRLYLSMDKGQMTIVKGKNWHQEGLNPNGMTAQFKLINGCEFQIIQPFGR